MQKPCHVPHASRITTSGTIFTKIFFGVSKEWVRSWPHAFLITNLKTLTKKLLAVRPEKWTGRERKQKKTRMPIAKLFALNANAISIYLKKSEFPRLLMFQYLCSLTNLARLIAFFILVSLSTVSKIGMYGLFYILIYSL